MELLMEHKKEFNLLSKLTEDEIKEYSETSINNQEVKQLTIKNMEDLLKLNITNKNVYDLLYIADYYEYDKIEEMIEKIQVLIFNSGWIFNKFKVNKYKLNNERLYNQIYDTLYKCDECKINPVDFKNFRFQHVICLKKIENKYKDSDYCECHCYNPGKICEGVIHNFINKYNNLNVIKYIVKNYTCKYNNIKTPDLCNVITKSCIFGHADITEYLIENSIGYDLFAILICIKNNKIECLKILDKYIDKFMCNNPYISFKYYIEWRQELRYLYNKINEYYNNKIISHKLYTLFINNRQNLIDCINLSY